MRAATALKRGGGGNNTVRHTMKEDDNGMMSSINDLMVEDVSPNASPGKQQQQQEDNHHDGGTTRRRSVSAAPLQPQHSARMPDPKLHLLSGLKSIEAEFESDLGTDWWQKSSSTETEVYMSGDLSVATNATYTAVPQNSARSAALNSTAVASLPTGSDSGNPPQWTGADNSNGNSSASTFKEVAAGNQQEVNGRSDSHNFAACNSVKMGEIVKRLEKLSHSALLTYAARISILVGNFYKLATEGNGTSGYSGEASSFRMHNANTPSRFSIGSPSNRNLLATYGESEALIGLYSRPVSSMTTFSDAPLGFSASTASLAHLPSVQDSNRVEVSGDIDEGTKTINDYVIVAPIGSGSQGSVELGVTLAGEPRAIKSLKRSALMKQNEAQIRREIAIMKKLRHENVVRLFEVIDDPSSNMIYLVMKYCSNGPLVHIRPDFTCDTIPLPVAKALLRQLLSGLHYLNLRRIVHRDIKPDNILLDHANVPCFVDFGVSGTVHQKSRTTTKNQGTAEGTPAFWAPELFVRKREEAKRAAGQDKNIFPSPPVDLMAADVYSLGATFYTAICGTTPFPCKDAESLADAAINDPLKLPDFLPAPWKDLFQKMMDKDPQRRAKIPSLKLHPVFTEDGHDPGSPHDDMKISDKDINGAVTKLKSKSGTKSQNDILDGDHDGEDEDADPFASPATPRGPKNNATSGNNRALFHRKVASSKKVSASGAASGPNTSMMQSTAPNVFAKNSSPSSSDPPTLPRSMSTARMPLKNIVKAGDNNNNNNGGSNNAAVKLPPLTSRPRSTQ